MCTRKRASEETLFDREKRSGPTASYLTRSRKDWVSFISNFKNIVPINDIILKNNHLMSLMRTKTATEPRDSHFR